MTNKQKTTNKALEAMMTKALAEQVKEVEQAEVDTSVQDVNECLYRAAIFATYYLLRKGKQSLYDNQETASLLLNAVKMSKAEETEFTKLLMHIYQSFVDMTDSGIIPVRLSALDIVKQYAKDSGKSIIKSAWVMYQDKKITYADYKAIMESED